MRLPTPTHIETICCIDRVKTFTAAALCLHTTQSAVSARVREVEVMLGVELFQRNGRTVEATIHGRRFIDTAGAYLHKLEDFIGSFGNISASAARIRIAVGNTSMASVAAMVRSLQEHLPLLQYDLETQHTNVMARELEMGRIELAIMSLPPSEIDLDRLAYRSLGLERLQWLIAAEKLASLHDQGASTAQELLDRCSVWCVPRPTSHFELAIASIEKNGGVIRNLNTSNNMPATLELVLAGAGIGLITDQLSATHRACGKLVPVFADVQPPPLEFFIACARERQSPLLVQVMEVAVATSTFSRWP